MKTRLSLATMIFSLLVFRQTEGQPDRHWRELPDRKPQSAEDDLLGQFNDKLVTLVDTLSPSVVNVYTKTKLTARERRELSRGLHEELFKFFMENPEDLPLPVPEEITSLGSGFVLNEKGYLVTNAHVIRPVERAPDEIMVKFKDQRGKGFPAEIVGFDESTDIAVIKLKKMPERMTPVYLGDSENLEVGEWVLAVGNPYGHANTVTQGIVSALGRNLMDIGNLADFIQTSANINPGSSGGPLFNLDGEVVGINTAIDPRAQGIGFAVPIALAKPVIRQLIEEGRVVRGWIGVSIADLSPELQSLVDVPVDYGAVIQSLEKGEPAEKAGIKVYDVIVEIDGRKTEDARGLSAAISALKPGRTVAVKLYRKNKEKNLQVAVKERPLKRDVAARASPALPPPATIENQMGFSLKELDGPIRRKLGIGTDVEGVVVEDVNRFGIAGQIGFSDGDVIVEVNQEPVLNVEAVIRTIKNSAKRKANVLFRVFKREGGFHLIVLEAASMRQ